VGFYAFYEGRGGGVIGQSPNVKASPDFIKCATDFERKWSFLVYKDRWPVVLEYAPNYIDHVAGEVVGHYMTINRYEISAETATLSRLPPPYNQPFNNSPIEALFNGYAETGLNHENFVQLGFKVPLYVGKADEAGYSRLAPSDEGAPSYTVVTDIYGQIVLLVSGQSSRYPKSETTLHVIVKTTIKKTAIKGIKIIVKNLWRLIF